AEIGAVLALLPAPPARVLDLGCGTGWTSLFFAKSGHEVTGVDIAPDMIRHALERRDREEQINLHFLTADYEDLDAAATFDAVVFFDSLHHAVDESAALRCAYRALKPGGVCVASEPGFLHSRSAVAQEAVRKYDVTEKKMPPPKILHLARRIGFRDFQVFPHAARLHREVFRRPELTYRQPGRAVRVLKLGARLAAGPIM